MAGKKRKWKKKEKKGGEIKQFDLRKDTYGLKWNSEVVVNIAVTATLIAADVVVVLSDSSGGGGSDGGVPGGAATTGVVGTDEG